jgi:lysophospholipase L1-like esterase
MRHPARLARRPVSAAALVFACATLAILVAAAAAAAGARYLALGDSVTFGYREPSTRPSPNYNNADAFQGYPEHMGRALRLRVANAACPGETSASLIDPKAPSNGCENINGQPVGYRRSYPLHVHYTGSQLAYAVDYLKKHPGTRLVSLMIGANDVFRCQRSTTDGCVSEFQATLDTIKKNVRRIVSAIRNKADYDGQLVIVHYYSLDYNSAFITGAVQALNGAQDAGAKGFGFDVADGFGKFRRASRHSGGSPCKAGLLTQLKGGGCGVHPSYSGQGLLALAVERPFSR